MALQNLYDKTQHQYIYGSDQEGIQNLIRETPELGGHITSTTCPIPKQKLFGQFDMKWQEL